MKLSMSIYSLSRWRPDEKPPVEELLQWMVSEGNLKYVEFSGLGRPEAKDPVKRAEQLKKYCDKIGLTPVSYCTGASFLKPAKKQKEAIAEVKRQVDVAAALQVPSMRHDVARGFDRDYPRYRGKKTFAEALKIVTPAVREVTEYGESVGVKTTLENHGFFMQGSKRVIQLIKKVDHPNFGLTMDMGNFLCVNEDPVEAVENAAPYSFMVHAKDFFIKPKKKAPSTGWIITPTPIAIRGAIVGHGLIDIPKQLKTLKKNKYKGYLSLEFEGMEEPGKACSLGLDYLREQLKAINAYEE